MNYAGSKVSLSSLRNIQNLNDNYYKGKYNYKTGTDALTEMGFTTDEFKKEYGQDIKLENIYSIN